MKNAIRYTQRLPFAKSGGTLVLTSVQWPGR